MVKNRMQMAPVARAVKRRREWDPKFKYKQGLTEWHSG